MAREAGACSARPAACRRRCAWLSRAAAAACRRLRRAAGGPPRPGAGRRLPPRDGGRPSREDGAFLERPSSPRGGRPRPGRALAERFAAFPRRRRPADPARFSNGLPSPRAGSDFARRALAERLAALARRRAAFAGRGAFLERPALAGGGRTCPRRALAERLDVRAPAHGRRPTRRASRTAALAARRKRPSPEDARLTGGLPPRRRASSIRRARSGGPASVRRALASGRYAERPRGRPAFSYRRSRRSAPFSHAAPRGLGGPPARFLGTSAQAFDLDLAPLAVAGRAALDPLRGPSPPVASRRASAETCLRLRGAYEVLGSLRSFLALLEAARGARLAIRVGRSRPPAQRRSPRWRGRRRRRRRAVIEDLARRN